MARRKGNVLINTEMQEIVSMEKRSVNSTQFREVQFKSLAEKIARDQLFYRNHYYPGGREAFAFNIRGATVDKYFPYAEGGPLFIDEVLRTEDQELFKKKTEIMKSLGHRYVAIMPGMTELDITERLV